MFSAVNKVGGGGGGEATIIFLAGPELEGEAVCHTCHGQKLITCMYRMF